MTIPTEFTAEGIADASVNAFTPYADFLDSGEPYRSMLANNPWARPPKAHEPLEWGQGRHYDTTVARKHPYWKDTPLPRATRDLNRLRHDLHDWGYCLIEDGLSKEQCERLYSRVADQAAAERALGIAYLDPAQQHVWSLVNKGEMFVRCLEHDTEFVQAGAVVERLLDETLGPGWNHYSLLSNISYPDCYPQGLHQDQNFIAPHRTLEGPPLVNAIYVLQDVDEVNGGTLIIPGSHRTRTEGDFYGPLPPTINLEAAAGTILIMDGRTFHAGAVNRSKKLRYIVTNSIVKTGCDSRRPFCCRSRLRCSSAPATSSCGVSVTRPMSGATSSRATAIAVTANRVIRTDRPCMCAERWTPGRISMLVNCRWRGSTRSMSTASP